MTSTSAKAQLLERLTEPIKGCKAYYTHKHNLMQRVMQIPDMEVRDCLERLQSLQG